MTLLRTVAICAFLAAVVAAAGIFESCQLSPPPAWAQDLPTANLEADDATPAVDQEVTVSWFATGAASVSLTRDGNQVSANHSGTTTYTPTDRTPVAFKITATNPSGSAVREIVIRPRAFSTPAGLVGLSPGGAAVAQMLIMVAVGTIFAVAGKFRPKALIAAVIVMPLVAVAVAALGIGSYWLASIVTLLLVVAGLGAAGLSRRA